MGKNVATYHTCERTIIIHIDSLYHLITQLCDSHCFVFLHSAKWSGLEIPVIHMAWEIRVDGFVFLMHGQKIDVSLNEKADFGSSMD